MALTGKNNKTTVAGQCPDGSVLIIILILILIAWRIRLRLRRDDQDWARAHLATARLEFRVYAARVSVPHRPPKGGTPNRQPFAHSGHAPIFNVECLLTIYRG
jgi:hypothetical protein